MCLAIVKPAQQSLEKADLYRAWQHNQDGCGFAVQFQGQLLIKKGLWDFPTFWTQLQPYLALPMLIHVRWASAGAISQAMCHPFRVGPYALIHNGTLQDLGTAIRSDTAIFCQDFLAPLLKQEPHLLEDTTFCAKVEAYLGTSKMALLGATGAPIFLNGHRGTWEQGVWYSNLYYRKPPMTKKAQGALFSFSTT